jgi:hypothetical protein
MSYPCRPSADAGLSFAGVTRRIDIIRTIGKAKLEMGMPAIGYCRDCAAAEDAASKSLL